MLLCYNTVKAGRLVMMMLRLNYKYLLTRLVAAVLADSRTLVAVGLEAEQAIDTKKWTYMWR